MARSFPSPAARIGIVTGQRMIRCRLVGRYRLEDAQRHPLGTLDESAEWIEFRPQDTTPAVVQWRAVLCKSPQREEAEHFTAALPGPGEGRTFDIETVGGTWQLPDGGVLDNREWWVHTPAFESRDAAAAWCRERDLLPLAWIPKLRRAPQGTIVCRSQGITASGLEVGGLFRLVPIEPRGSRVVLSGVVVGIDFHWQHLETQFLRGSLEVLLDLDGHLTAVNELPLEAYLCSVVASEMKAGMPHELLKVQAVCARNTFLATAGKHHRGQPFDLCADDHCQCYRGSTRETREAREAAISTWGEVLVSRTRLCDTRYSKICGGVSESAHSVWGGPPIEYMRPVADFPDAAPDKVEPRLHDEALARAHVQSAPRAFCNVGARPELPEYIRYAAKYYRWQVVYTREELEALLRRLPAVQPLGEIRALEPRVRGDSGRIERLAVIGEKGEALIGRELAIRQALSSSTLFSSCFVVDHERDPGGRLRSVTLHGAGWGHGAGLCQVGAAVMALENYSHEQILLHYYRGTALRLVYEQPTNWAGVLDHFDDGDFSLHDRCWEATNCYEVVGCPVYERLVGPHKGYAHDAVRTKMYLDCPEYERQTAGQPTPLPG